MTKDNLGYAQEQLGNPEGPSNLVEHNLPKLFGSNSALSKSLNAVHTISKKQQELEDKKDTLRGKFLAAQGKSLQEIAKATDGNVFSEQGALYRKLDNNIRSTLTDMEAYIDNSGGDLPASSVNTYLEDTVDKLISSYGNDEAAISIIEKQLSEGLPKLSSKAVKLRQGYLKTRNDLNFQQDLHRASSPAEYKDIFDNFKGSSLDKGKLGLSVALAKLQMNDIKGVHDMLPLIENDISPKQLTTLIKNVANVKDALSGKLRNGSTQLGKQQIYHIESEYNKAVKEVNDSFKHYLQLDKTSLEYQNAETSMKDRLFRLKEIKVRQLVGVGLYPKSEEGKIVNTQFNLTTITKDPDTGKEDINLTKEGLRGYEIYKALKSSNTLSTDTMTNTENFMKYSILDTLVQRNGGRLTAGMASMAEKISQNKRTDDIKDIVPKDVIDDLTSDSDLSKVPLSVIFSNIVDIRSKRIVEGKEMLSNSEISFIAKEILKGTGTSTGFISEYLSKRIHGPLLGTPGLDSIFNNISDDLPDDVYISPDIKKGYDFKFFGRNIREASLAILAHKRDLFLPGDYIGKEKVTLTTKDIEFGRGGIWLTVDADGSLRTKFIDRAEFNQFLGGDFDIK